MAKTDQVWDIDEAYVEVKKHKKFNEQKKGIAFAIAILPLFLLIPLEILILADATFMDKLSFLAGAFQAETKAQLINNYILHWIPFVPADGKSVDDSVKQFVFWLTYISVPILGAWLWHKSAVKKNPYSKVPNIYGDTRWARREDVDKMSGTNRVGTDKDLFVCGLFVDDENFNQFDKLKTEVMDNLKQSPGKADKAREQIAKISDMVKMGETLSVLLLAPPGTGKTVSFIVPSIVSMDKSSMFVHDQKPELFDLTSGHRATLGPVYQLKWAAMDAPEGEFIPEDQAKIMNEDFFVKNEDGSIATDDFERWKTIPLYYPSWNPIGDSSLPAPGPKRDQYIERLWNVLMPGGGQGDKFWEDKGKAAGIGLTHYIIGKVDAARNEHDKFQNCTYEGLPERYHGSDSSFPLLVDWFSDAQTSVADGSDDPMREVFKTALDEAYALNKIYEEEYGFPTMQRAINELAGLMNSPDKTRGSILETMTNGLTPFKNEAVRQRTVRSDFGFSDLRGVPNREAKEREDKIAREMADQGRKYMPKYAKDEYEPLTVYISVNAEDAKAFATITGIFVDSANAYLVANGPDTVDDRGNKLGPLDFCFMIDEAPQLPPLDTIKEGPAVGRSKRVSYIIVGQDYAQFAEKYSENLISTLNSNTAIKIILSQNNADTAKKVSDMTGQRTVEVRKENKKKPQKGDFGSQIDAFLGKKDKDINYQSLPFLTTTDIMGMPSGQHIVLVQEFMNRPLKLKTPRYFDPGMEEIGNKVMNAFTKIGPRPSLPMPELQMKEAGEKAKTAQKNVEIQREINQKLNEPRRVFIVTPKDIQVLAQNSNGELPEKDNLYAAFEADVELTPFMFDYPDEEAFLITDDLDKLVEFVGGNHYYVFDDHILNTEINDLLAEQGKNVLQRDGFVSLAELAIKAEENNVDDIYSLGTESNAAMHPPARPEDVTPTYALKWFAELVTMMECIRNFHNDVGI